jgi:HK97 family phage portal protein
MSFLQSLASAFKGGSGKVPLARSFTSPWFVADVGSGQTAYEYNRSVRRAYLENPVAQRAVRLVAEGIGGAPLIPADAGLAALVSATSAGQSLLETLASHLLLHGNGYVQVMKDGAGRPVELFALRPERMSVVAGEDGWPSAFTYKVGEKALTIPLLDEDASPNLIHIKDFHPADDHYGAGCLAAADQAIATHNAASNWNRTLLENAARPSGALVYDGGDMGGLTTEQFDRLKGELTQAFSGQFNAGRPMVLEGGLKWQPLGLSPADMDFATLKAAAARDIALAFGVPPMLLGLPGDSTYANYREANRALWRLTLLPLASKLLSALGEGLALWFPDPALGIDLDRVPALSEDRERYWAQLNTASFLSDAEKRAFLGLPEAPKSMENKR